MNTNNLPFMRSLHNLSRPHQFLRNNHPVGGTPHSSYTQKESAGIVVSKPHAPRPNAAGQMAHMAHGPRMAFADGGYVPTLEQLGQVDVTQPYPYDGPFSMDNYLGRQGVQQANANLNAGIIPPTLLRSGDAIDVPLATQSRAQSSLSNNEDGTFTDSNPAANKKGFLGLSGKDWLNIGLGALKGVTGYADTPQFAGIAPHSARQAQQARSGYAEGGQIQAPQPQDTQAPAQSPRQVIMAAAAVIAGQSDDQGAIQAFVQRFGKAELQHLVQMVQSGQLQLPQQGQPQPQQQMAPQGPQMPQDAMANGGLVQGPGDGTSDSVSAVHAPTGMPIQLSGGEGIVPADAMAALGNGSSEAGGRKLQAGIAALRHKKGMKRTHANPPDLGPNENPLFDGR